MCKSLLNLPNVLREERSEREREEERRGNEVRGGRWRRGEKEGERVNGTSIEHQSYYIL